MHPLNKALAAAIAVLICIASSLAGAPHLEAASAGTGEPDAENPYATLFEAVWTAVGEYWVGGLDPEAWASVREHFEPATLAAESDAEAYEILQEMLALLGDPGTFVATPEIAEALSTPRTPSDTITGIGVILAQTPEGEVVAIDLVGRGPAERAGVRRGDRIAAVDGEAAAALSFEEVAERIRGSEGSTVHLTLRDPRGAERTIAVRRARVRVAPQVESAWLAGQVGYIAVPSFRRGMETEVLNHLRRYYRSRGLVLDLRRFDGSVDLGALLRIAGLFTDEPLGAALTRTGTFAIAPDREWAGGTGSILAPPPTSLDFYTKPLAVIADATLLTRAETLALVRGLQDTGRAVIVGRGTSTSSPYFGSLKAEIPLPGGGVMSLTTAQLVSVAKQELLDGFVPDLEVPMDRAFLEAWWDGGDLDVEAARLEVLRQVDGP